MEHQGRSTSLCLGRKVLESRGSQGCQQPSLCTHICMLLRLFSLRQIPRSEISASEDRASVTVFLAVVTGDPPQTSQADLHLLNSSGKVWKLWMGSGLKVIGVVPLPSISLLCFPWRWLNSQAGSSCWSPGSSRLVSCWLSHLYKTRCSLSRSSHTSPGLSLRGPGRIPDSDAKVEPCRNPHSSSWNGTWCPLKSKGRQ